MLLFDTGKKLEKAFFFRLFFFYTLSWLLKIPHS